MKWTASRVRSASAAALNVHFVINLRFSKYVSIPHLLVVLVARVTLSWSGMLSMQSTSRRSFTVWSQNVPSYGDWRTRCAASGWASDISLPKETEERSIFPMENGTYQMMSDRWTSNYMLRLTKGKSENYPRPKAAQKFQDSRGRYAVMKTYLFLGLTLGRKHPVDVRWTSNCNTFYTLRVCPLSS